MQSPHAAFHLHRHDLTLLAVCGVVHEFGGPGLDCELNKVIDNLFADDAFPQRQFSPDPRLQFFKRHGLHFPSGQSGRTSTLLIGLPVPLHTGQTTETLESPTRPVPLQFSHTSGRGAGGGAFFSPISM